MELEQTKTIFEGMYTQADTESETVLGVKGSTCLSSIIKFQSKSHFYFM